jgi:hypothetical protein
MNTKEMFKKLETLSEMIPLEAVAVKLKKDVDKYEAACAVKNKELIHDTSAQLILSIKMIMDKIGNEDKTEENIPKTKSWLKSQLDEMINSI